MRPQQIPCRSLCGHHRIISYKTPLFQWDHSTVISRHHPHTSWLPLPALYYTQNAVLCWNITLFSCSCLQNPVIDIQSVFAELIFQLAHQCIPCLELTNLSGCLMAPADLLIWPQACISVSKAQICVLRRSASWSKKQLGRVTWREWRWSWEERIPTSYLQMLIVSSLFHLTVTHTWWSHISSIHIAGWSTRNLHVVQLFSESVWANQISVFSHQICSTCICDSRSDSYLISSHVTTVRTHYNPFFFSTSHSFVQVRHVYRYMHIN